MTEDYVSEALRAMLVRGWDRPRRRIRLMPRGKPRDVTCDWCGAVFTGYRSSARFCTSECRRAWHLDARWPRDTPWQALEARRQWRAADARRRAPGGSRQSLRPRGPSGLQASGFELLQPTVDEALTAFATDPRYAAEMAKAARKLLGDADA